MHIFAYMFSYPLINIEILKLSHLSLNNAKQGLNNSIFVFKDLSLFIKNYPFLNYFAN